MHMVPNYNYNYNSNFIFISNVNRARFLRR
jgi:hypothetical protein